MDGRPSALSTPVGGLVDLDRDGRLDPAPAQVLAVGGRAVGLVSQDPVRAGTRTLAAGPRYPDTGQHPGELRAVTALPTGHQHRQGFAALLTAQMQLRGPATAGTTQRMVGGFILDPHFGGRPGFLPLGSSGASAAHCASVRSNRLGTGKVATRSPGFVLFVDERSTGDLAVYRSTTCRPGVQIVSDATTRSREISPSRNSECATPGN